MQTGQQVGWPSECDAQTEQQVEGLDHGLYVAVVSLLMCTSVDDMHDQVSVILKLNNKLKG